MKECVKMCYILGFAKEISNKIKLKTDTYCAINEYNNLIIEKLNREVTIT